MKEDEEDEKTHSSPIGDNEKKNSMEKSSKKGVERTKKRRKEGDCMFHQSEC